MTEFIDFDEMMREAEPEVLTVRIFGQSHAIKRAIPAYVPLMLARHDGNAAEQSRVLADAAVMLFGEEAVVRWLKRPDFTIARLNRLMAAVFEAINGERPASEITEDGGNERPN